MGCIMWSDLCIEYFWLAMILVTLPIPLRQREDTGTLGMTIEAKKCLS